MHQCSLNNCIFFLQQLLDEYPKCFIVGADNVGSTQMQQIRIALRGHSIILMGKNTMMRKAIKDHMDTNPALEKLLPHIKGNVGFVFTRGDLVEVRDKLLENKVRAPARPGAIAPLSVVIPAHNTGLGPEKTSFFQALSIPTKISKGKHIILLKISYVIQKYFHSLHLSIVCSNTMERNVSSLASLSDKIKVFKFILV